MRSRKPGAKAYGPEWRKRVSQGLRRSNATKRERARITAGDFQRWQERGLVADALRPVAELAQREALEVAKSLGGSETMSAQRRVLLADFTRLGIALGGLLAHYLQTEGPDFASRIATVANARRQHLLALGLDERKVEQDLGAYLAAKAAEKRANGSEGVATAEAPASDESQLVDAEVTRPTILEALADRKLLGASCAFRDLAPSQAWLTFAAATYGLPLDDEEAALFCEATGRTRYDPPPGGGREVLCAVGRQAGKTRTAAALVTFEAALAPETTDGEVYALLLAQDQRAAIRTAFSYIVGMFDASPLFRRLVVHRTTDTLHLSNGVRVAAYPCRPAAVRGLRAIVAVADELAHYRGSDMRPLDVETLRALRPTLATTGGRLVILSSPHGSVGARWELFRRHHGRDEAPMLTWHASAPTMHPTLPADYLDRMREDDPEAYRREVLGEFTSDLAALFDHDALEACVATGRRELPPVADVEYLGFVDPSGGRRDAYTAAIAHRDGERVVVDVVRAWRAPFNPTGVTAEAADLLRADRLQRVIGDHYAGEWPREAFRAHGIEYAPSAHDKSELYLAALPVVNSGTVELPDDPALLRELRALERRRARAGRDRVDHPPGQHDERANAGAGAIQLAKGPQGFVHVEELRL